MAQPRGEIGVAVAELTEVSDFLLQLYADSRERDPSTYATAALAGVRRLLSADKACWGIISHSRAGRHLRSSFTSGLQPGWQSCWESVKHDDSLAKAIARTRNRTVTLESAELPAASGLLRLADGFDIGQTLSASLDFLDPDTFMFVSVYRNHGRRSFSQRDKTINQLLIPHLQAAWNENLRESLRASNGSSRSVYRVFVDHEARPVGEHEEFAMTAARHWQAWRGPILPPELRQAMQRSHAAGGAWISGRNWSVRATPAGLLILVELRERSQLDNLTKRKLEVSKLFAHGATHKDIARLAGLRPSTVRHYLREAYAKLGIDNKASLASIFTRLHVES